MTWPSFLALFLAQGRPRCPLLPADQPSPPFCQVWGRHLQRRPSCTWWGGHRVCLGVLDG